MARLELTFILLLVAASAQLGNADYLYFICSTFSSFTTNSSYQQNLNNVLLTLFSNASKNGFAIATAGQSPDQAYGLALCRGDVSPNDCASCISDAAAEIVHHCPNGKSAIIWYDNCLLRYSGRNFFGTVDTINEFYMWNSDDVWIPTLFNSMLGALMNNLSSTATTDPSGRLYAIGKTRYNDSHNIYGLVQCTRDISSSGCSNCLKNAISEIPMCCDGKQGGRVVGASCNIRYEMYLFFQGLVETQPSPPPDVASPPAGPPPSNSTPASPTSSKPPDPMRFRCPTASNFTANSTYQRNLNALFLSLSSSPNASKNGFATVIAGRSPDQVYGLVLCRGDVSENDCMACISDATAWIVQRCSVGKSAITWYDNCLLRYADINFFGRVDTGTKFYLWNPNYALDSTLFNSLLGSLMANLSSSATSDPSGRLFATGETRFDDRQKIYGLFDDRQKIYGLVQCSRDISTIGCTNCLISAISEIPVCCDRKRGGRVVMASCNVRFEMYSFFKGLVGPQPSLASVVDSPPEAPPASTAPPPSNAAHDAGPTTTKSRRSMVIIISVLVPTALILCFLAAFLCTKKSKKKSITQGDHEEEFESKTSLIFDLSSIKAATNNFSDANKLGEGSAAGWSTNSSKEAVKKLGARCIRVQERGEACRKASAQKPGSASRLLP